MTAIYVTTTTMNDTRPLVNTAPTSSKAVGLDSFDKWSQWEAQRHTRRSDLLYEGKIDPREVRHMTLSAGVNEAEHNNHNSNHQEDMAAGVAAFFQSVGCGNQNGTKLPQQNSFATTSSLAVFDNNYYAAGGEDHSVTSSEAATVHPPLHRQEELYHHYVSIAELRQSPSFMAEQQKLWNRVKKQQQTHQQNQQQQTQPVDPITPAPYIPPEWFQGHRYRVVRVNSHSPTQRITCVGCSKTMLADASVDIVYCPTCGSTFSLDAVAAAAACPSATISSGART